MRKADSTPRWRARLLLVVIGGVISATGLAIVHMGYSWVAQSNTWVGTPGYAPSLAFVLFGLIFVIIGLVPWPKSSESKKHISLAAQLLVSNRSYEVKLHFSD
jgi:hypothetical protein